MGPSYNPTVRNLVRGLARYRPAAATVGVIWLMVAFLPGERFSRQGLVSTAPPPVRPAPVVPANGGDPGSTASGAEGELAVQPSDTFSTGATFGPGAGAGARSGATRAPSAGHESVAPDAPLASGQGTGAEPEKPLRITARLYASLAAGTPLATASVPEGSLPVGKRASREDKRSYVRLAGTAKELRLTEGTDGRETHGPVVVQACQVAEGGWDEGKGVPLDSAPKFDPAACVVGVRASDGLWSFDLSSFSDPTDDRGIALTVGPGAGVDFQVNLVEVQSSGA